MPAEQYMQARNSAHAHTDLQLAKLCRAIHADRSSAHARMDGSLARMCSWPMLSCRGGLARAPAGRAGDHAQTGRAKAPARQRPRAARCSPPRTVPLPLPSQRWCCAARACGTGPPGSAAPGAPDRAAQVNSQELTDLGHSRESCAGALQHSPVFTGKGCCLPSRLLPGLWRKYVCSVCDNLAHCTWTDSMTAATIHRPPCVDLNHWESNRPCRDMKRFTPCIWKH